MAGAPEGNQNAAGNRGGAIGRSGPPGNGNALKHGVYRYLHTGALPEEVQLHVDQFALDLDAEIHHRYRDAVPLAVTCERETAVTNFAVALLRARWAGQEGLTVEERDKLVSGVLSALDKRDAKVRGMDLEGGEQENPFAGLAIPAGVGNGGGE